MHMPKKISHVQNRQFLGDEASAQLVAWLNSPEQTRAHTRILRIMTLLTEEGGTHEELAKALHQYHYYPAIYPNLRKVVWWPADHVPGPDLFRKLLFGEIPYGEERAVLDLVSLIQIGALRGVRQCRHCKKWLFARFCHQQYCSQRCRERHFQSSAEWKARRNSRQREYYRLHKTTNVVSPGRKVATRKPNTKTKAPLKSK